MGGRGAVVAGVAVWAGILLGAGLGVPAACTLLVAALLLAALAWSAPPHTGAVLTLLALAFAGGARGAGHQAALRAQRGFVARGGDFYRVAARVVEPPPREAGEPVAVLAVTAARPPLAQGTRLRARLPAGSPVEWGDRVDAALRLDL